MRGREDEWRLLSIWLITLVRWLICDRGIRSTRVQSRRKVVSGRRETSLLRRKSRWIRADKVENWRMRRLGGTGGCWKSLTFCEQGYVVRSTLISGEVHGESNGDDGETRRALFFASRGPRTQSHTTNSRKFNDILRDFHVPYPLRRAAPTKNRLRPLVPATQWTHDISKRGLFTRPLGGSSDRVFM